MQPLTNKQKAFVEDYCSNGWNATKAATTAGYAKSSVRVTGCQNITKPNIKAAIDAYKAEIQRVADYTREKAQRELDRALAIAEGKHDAQAMTGAIRAKSKLYGLEIERHQFEVVEGTRPADIDEAKARIRKRIDSVIS